MEAPLTRQLVGFETCRRCGGTTVDQSWTWLSAPPCSICKGAGEVEVYAMRPEPQTVNAVTRAAPYLQGFVEAVRRIDEKSKG